MQVSRRQ